MEPISGPPGLSNGPPALQGGSEEPSGTQSEGGCSSSSGAGSPGPPGILRPVQPLQRSDTPRRNSSSSSSPSERPRQKLSRKAASSANLLLRSGSTESRGNKDPLSSPGGPGSRRSNYNLEGISVKMFLRGRPITMYIPSGIRSLEELPSGPPSETLSLDWVYPILFHGQYCFPQWVPLPSLQFLSVCVGDKDSCESSPTIPMGMVMPSGSFTIFLVHS